MPHHDMMLKNEWTGHRVETLFLLQPDKIQLAYKQKQRQVLNQIIFILLPQMYTKICLLLVAVLAVAQTQNMSYPCNVDHCQQCSYYNFCGLCNPNYILSINKETNQPYCALVECDVSNCVNCLQNNVCSQCAADYFINAAGTCTKGTNDVTCPSYCSYCKEEGECLRCSYGYILQKDGYCYPRVPLATWCQVGFYLDMCQLCMEGYIVEVGYGCVKEPTFTCNVDTGCMECSSENECSECSSGYKLMNGNCTALECNISYCAECSDSSTCSACMDRYKLMNNECKLKTYGCNYDHCIACATSPQICTQCQAGYYLQQLMDENGATIAMRCVQITEAKGTNSELVKYCSKLGMMLLGTDTTLTYGCLTCMQNYINIGGFCVANITQSNYLCDINNCEYCIQNNYCGQCQDGYYIQLFTGGYCWKKYSPLPYCKLTTIFAPICVVCDDGYVLQHTYCVKYDPAVSCKVQGCQYCIESDDCMSCRTGYEFRNSSNTTCEALCSVDNCFQCEDSSKCAYCTFGYVLLQDGTCILATDAQANCTAEYGAQCTQCNAAKCTQCADGYILDEQNNFCCQPPTQNYHGCVQYQSVCSSTCTACQPGYVLVSNQCFTFPCSLDHCNYCFRSDVCIVCEDGFTLQNGVCTSFTESASCPNDCVTCDADGACTQCVNGYKIYEGYCVCDFQNCLECQGDAFCKVCAFPTIGLVIADNGCSPLIIGQTQCELDNCQNCIVPNKCGECFIGYTLEADGTCSKISCTDDENCLLCDEGQNICFLCAQGFLQNEIFGSSCVPLSEDYACSVEGCQVCETSDTCETCNQLHQLTSDKKCQRYNCIDNCLFCFEANTCFVCDINYYVTTNNTCAPTTEESRLCDSIDNCLICGDKNQTSSELICSACFLGFEPDSDGKSCEPQDCDVPYCQVCLPTGTMMMDMMGKRICILCQQGYFLNSYLQCVSYTPSIDAPTCAVYNCLFCDRDSECSLCLGGWNATGKLCQTNLYCDVSDCSTCTTPENCTACNENYELVLGGCTPQCNITNCDECATLQKCGTCKQTYVLSDNDTKCTCPDDTFVQENNKCVCPDGKLQFNSTCVQCTIEYCSFCSSANVCGECLETFNLENNTCKCNDDTYQIVSDKCVCPTDFKEHDNTCIQCNIQYCAQCNTANNCLNCEDTFTKDNNTCICATDFTLFEDKCYLCNNASFCEVCSGTNFCNQCKQTFEVDNGSCVCPQSTTLFNSQCVACEITNCDLCEEANVCKTCADFYTKIKNVCVSCNIQNCQSCSSQNYCAQCSNSLQVSSQGNSCVTCDKDNCDICSDNNICASCSNGFQFNKDKTQCVNCSTVAGCNYCSADNTCSECLSGFTLSNGACSVCSSPCQTCKSNGTCETCKLPFSTNANSEGECFTCSVTNCKTCSSATASTCETCMDSYTKNSENLCILICSTNLCTKCDDPDVCELCIAGYTPDGSGCKKCGQPTKCASCQSQDINVCTDCNDGYYLDGGLCKACSDQNCAKCPDGADTCSEYRASTNQIAFTGRDGKVVPAVCNQGCQQCSTTNPNVCITCLTGYSLQSGNCIACTFPCKTCQNNNQSACLSCYSTAFLSNNECLTCTSSSNCLTCSESNRTQCTACPYGFSLASNNTCVQGCPANCLSCKSSTVCSVCIEGYSANSDGVCLPCLSTCRGCSGSQQAVCLDCGKGFYLSSEGDCEVCTQFCQTCTENGCSQCVTGYTLTSSFVCVQNCKVPCATCSSTDPTKCNTCVAGYSLDSTISSCQAVTSCADNICDVCPFGYVLDGGQCFECNQTCGRCSTTNKDTCTSCLDGKYLQGSSCVSCPDGCETCSTGSNCLTCSSGYTAESSPVSATVNCVQCESPCSQCIGDSQTCTSCVSGFELKGWKCLSTFNFGFHLVLNTNLTFFYTKYESFLVAIANAVETQNINVVTMINLISGSVNNTGNVTTTSDSNSAEATTEFNSLGSVLSSGNTIGDMEITSAELSANGGEVQESDNGPNLALILGITIPLAIILIGGIIYFCCARKNKLNYSQKPYEETDMTVRQQFELTNDVTGRAI